MKRFDFANGASIYVDQKYEGTGSTVKFRIPTQGDGVVIAQDLQLDLADMGYLAGLDFSGDDIVVTAHSADRGTTLGIIEAMTHLLRYKEGFHIPSLEQAKKVLSAALGRKTFKEFLREREVSEPLWEGLNKDYGEDLGVLYFRILNAMDPKRCRTIIYDAAREMVEYGPRYPELDSKPYIRNFLTSVRQFEEEDRINSLPSKTEQFKKFNNAQLEILRNKLLAQNFASSFVNSFCNSLRSCTNSGEVLGSIMSMVDREPQSYAGIADAAGDYKTAIRTFWPQQPEAARSRS